MLAGVGGRTIKEARRNLTMKELHQWMAFKGKNGPLFLGRRLDAGIARLCAVLANCNGAKAAKMEDFLPKYGTTEEDVELTPEMFHRRFGGAGD